MLDFHTETLYNQLVNTTITDVLDALKSETTEEVIREKWTDYQLGLKLNNILFNLDNKYLEEYKDVLSQPNYVVYDQEVEITIKDETTGLPKLVKIYLPTSDCLKDPKDTIEDGDKVIEDIDGNVLYVIKKECQDLIDQGLVVLSKDLYREKFITDFINNLDTYKEDIDYTEYVSIIKNEALNIVNDEFQKAMSIITSKYPEHEQLTWPQQKAEALAYKADNTANTPLIDNISKARNIDKDTLVDKILTKAEEYETISGQAIGYRQLAEDMLNAVTNVDELSATIDKLREYKNIFYSIING